MYYCLCFLSLICSVLHCVSIAICAEPRANDDEADFINDNLVAGKLDVLKNLIDDSTDPGLSIIITNKVMLLCRATKIGGARLC